MINYIQQLNEIVRNLSSENATASISQLEAIIDLSSKAGIRFSVYVNYDEAFSSFTDNQFPEWNMEVTNLGLESLAKQSKYAEAAVKRDKTLLLKNEIHKHFRLEKYGTDEWFTPKSESEIFFLPTEIAVIDNLILGYMFKNNVV
jgi:hypothetical protein